MKKQQYFVHPVAVISRRLPCNDNNRPRSGLLLVTPLTPFKDIKRILRELALYNKALKALRELY